MDVTKHEVQYNQSEACLKMFYSVISGIHLAVGNMRLYSTKFTTGVGNATHPAQFSQSEAIDAAQASNLYAMTTETLEILS